MPDQIPHTLANFWKASVLYYLRSQVLGIVDDNHGLSKRLPENYSGQVFLFGPKNGEIDPDKIIRVPTWKEVYPIIETHNPLLQH
jgi:hypothetical protein